MLRFCEQIKFQVCCCGSCTCLGKTLRQKKTPHTNHPHSQSSTHAHHLHAQTITSSQPPTHSSPPLPTHWLKKGWGTVELTAEVEAEAFVPFKNAPWITLISNSAIYHSSSKVTPPQRRAIPRRFGENEVWRCWNRCSVAVIRLVASLRNAPFLVFRRTPTAESLDISPITLKCYSNDSHFLEVALSWRVKALFTERSLQSEEKESLTMKFSGLKIQFGCHPDNTRLYNSRSINMLKEKQKWIM